MQLDRKINIRSVMLACESSIKTLQEIRARMLNVDSSSHQIDWTIGSMISLMIAQLLIVCNEAFLESLQAEDGNAKLALLDIKAQFNNFMTMMINGQDL